MSLISMDSQKKNQEVNKLIQTNFGSRGGGLWTGGHDYNISRYFEWISTGEAFAYTNWRSGEPTNVKFQCVLMVMGESLAWGDYNCITQYGFVCEETPMQKATNEDLIFLKASLDNQTNLLKEKTVELNSLKKEFERLKNAHEIQTNLNLEIEERNKLIEQRLDEMKEKQEEFVNFQKSSKQQMSELNRTKNEYNKAQISSEIEIKQMLKDIQTTLQQNHNQISQSGANKSIEKQDISNPTYCAGLLTAKSSELEALKSTNEILMKELFGVLQKSYELNTNRTIANRSYNIFLNFNKN